MAMAAMEDWTELVTEQAELRAVATAAAARRAERRPTSMAVVEAAACLSAARATTTAHRSPSHAKSISRTAAS